MRATLVVLAVATVLVVAGLSLNNTPTTVVGAVGLAVALVLGVVEALRRIVG